MNNVYITCFGIDTRSKYMNSYEEIINLLRGHNVAIIPNAKLLSQDRSGSTTVESELLKNGITCSIFDIDSRTSSELDAYDAIYVCPGEARYLMQSIYSKGFYDKIENFIKSGKLYIGVAAGAMILSKRYVDTSLGSVMMKEDGFELFPKSIVPHFENLPSQLRSQMPVDRFELKDSDKVMKLPLL